MTSLRLNLKSKMLDTSKWNKEEQKTCTRWRQEFQDNISLSAWMYLDSHYERLKMTDQQGSMSFTVHGNKRSQSRELSVACGAYVVDNPEGILLEARFCAHGEMFDYLNAVLDDSTPAPPVSKALLWIEHLKESLAALHEQGFYIGDIKTENMVLCGPQHEPFIIDVDMMHHVPTSIMTLGTHTLAYTPFEVQLFLQSDPKPIFTKPHWIKFRRFVDTAQMYVVFGMILYAAGVPNKWIHAGFELGPGGHPSGPTQYKYLRNTDGWFQVPVEDGPQGMTDEEKEKVDQILATADELLIHAKQYVKANDNTYTDDKLKSMLTTSDPPILTPPGLGQQSPLEASDTCVIKFVPEKHRKLLNIEQLENIHWPRYVIPVHQVWPVVEVSKHRGKKRIKLNFLQGYHQYVRKEL